MGKVRIGAQHIEPFIRKLRRNALPPPSSAQEEEELIEKVRAGDENAKVELLLRFIRLILDRASRYASLASAYGVDFNDLVMDGIFVLYYAAKRYNPTKARFSTYLTTALDREMRRRLCRYPTFGRRVVNERYVYMYVDDEEGRVAITSLDDPDLHTDAMQQDTEALERFSRVEDAILVDQILEAASGIDDPSIPILMAYTIGGQKMPQITKDYMMTPRAVTDMIHRASILVQYKIGLFK